MAASAALAMHVRGLPAGAVLLGLLMCACSAPESPVRETGAMKVDDELERRDQPVSDEDVLILQKAADLLVQEAMWNRQDDRECADDEATGRRSLFCALQKACIDVLGKYDHRRVALQEVRFAVEDATRGQDFEHRLRDFNNLPATTLDDVRKVLEVASARVQARLTGQRHAPRG